MLAEIHGKVNQQNTNLSELSEDELTGNFFGCLRYIPFKKGLKKILSNAVYPREFQDLIDKIDVDYWKDNLHLWKKETENGMTTELDVRIDFSSIVIGIEVKFLSGLSSEDTETDNTIITAENSFNQLSREARILNLVGKGKEKLLLLLADETSCANIINKSQSKIIDGVHLGYISWQEALIQLKKLNNLNNYEKIIVSDLIDLLENKGFVRFENFDLMQSHDIDSGKVWTFEQANKTTDFTFSSNTSVGGSYYVFR